MDESILKTIRSSILGDEESEEFDDDLLLHINSSILTLRQNGITNNIMVKGVDETWEDLKDENKNNEYFNQVPQFISLNTRILFDPPPPSNVEFYNNRIDELLWRLKVAYEEEQYGDITTLRG